MAKQKVALVTGASSGIGEAAAIALAEGGFRVYAAARRVERMRALAGHGVRPIALDVTDEASMSTCVADILAAEGRIDVLVNNAGYGSYGAVEDVPLDEARRQFDVNIFGLARMTQLVLPAMRKQRSGRIINISSMGGKMYTPFGGWYHATKHALEGLSDCLRLELKPFGIDVAIIEPGGIKTDWGTIAADNLAKTSGQGPYGRAARRAAKGLKRLYTGRLLTSPEVIADAILDAATARRPKTRYAVGFMAKPSIALRKRVSDRTFDRIIKRMA